MKLKINRRHTINISEIEKFIFKNDIVWAYRKKGSYPPILKTDYNAYTLRLRLVNLGLSIKDFKIEE